MAYRIRSAEPEDYFALHSFVQAQNHLHRHLDWRDSLEWIGREPFFLLEENRKIQAVLAAPPEPERVAWVRLFGVSPQLQASKGWEMLFPPVREMLLNLEPRPALVSLSLRDWYGDLLKRQSFTHHQDIVVFLYDQPAPPAPLPVDPAICIRPLEQADLDQTVALDNQSFEPIWQLSYGDMQHAYQRSSYMTVAEIDGQIVAYQMSSGSGVYAHLARLAVRPDLQRRGLGFRMVQDLLQHFLMDQKCWGVTLNTQNDNHASIALYRRVGFRETGERFPVFKYPL